MKSRVNWPKTLAYYAVVIFSALFVYGAVFPVRVPDRFSASFSAERVAEDVKVVDRIGRSGAGDSRNILREYLYYRLKQMGGTTSRLRYDSLLSFDGKTKKINISDVYSVFTPGMVGDSAKTGYVVLVARIDSGYGASVILELVKQALRYREYWHGGIKVLFIGGLGGNYLHGMRSAMYDGDLIFKNANLVFDIASAGRTGPVMLLGTSEGNSSVIRLFQENVRRACAYSAAGRLYERIFPESEFSLLRDSLPALLFSPIGNLRQYYNYGSDITDPPLKTLQSYGIQIDPVIHAYLTSGGYSAVNSFKSDSDSIYFSFPGLGMYVTGKRGYFIISILTYIVFIISLLYYIQAGKVKINNVLRYCMYSAFFCFGAFVSGTAVSFFSSLLCGERYSFLKLSDLGCYSVIMVILLAILFFWILIFYRFREKKSEKLVCYNFLFGTLLFIIPAGIVVRIIMGEDIFLLIPLLASAATLFLGIFKNLRFFYLVAAGIVSVVGFSVVTCIYIILSFGASGIVLMISSMYMLLLIAQYYCFKRDFL
ncbi:MAG: hypothetical protein LKI53_07260 [Bacteroidales bacterium]|jgi:hypothetical protein|nr:hypothetical protein [Bacteroidales bacterium]